MVDSTLLRVEVGNARVAGLLDSVPGVAAAPDLTALTDEASPPPRPTPGGGETPPPSTDQTAGGRAIPDVDLAAQSDDGRGLTEKLLDAWQEWGLLGLGVSMTALGVAIAAVWVYRRRKNDDADADEWDGNVADSVDDADADEFGEQAAEPVDEWRPDGPDEGRVGSGADHGTPSSDGSTATGTDVPATTDAEPTATSLGEATDGTDDPETAGAGETVLGDEASDATVSRTSGETAPAESTGADVDGVGSDTGSHVDGVDSDDSGFAGGDFDDDGFDDGASDERSSSTTPGEFDVAGAEADEPDEPDEPLAEARARATADVNVAPLLGMGFLAVAGALVRRVQRDAGDTA